MRHDKYFWWTFGIVELVAILAGGADKAENGGFWPWLLLVTVMVYVASWVIYILIATMDHESQ